MKGTSDWNEIRKSIIVDKKDVEVKGITVGTTTVDSVGIHMNEYSELFLPYHHYMQVLPPIVWELPGVFKNTEKINKEREMNVYEVYIIDKKECVIAFTIRTIARDEKAAMIMLNLSDEVKQKFKDGEIEAIFKNIGSFERIEKDKAIEEVGELSKMIKQAVKKQDKE